MLKQFSVFLFLILSVQPAISGNAKYPDKPFIQLQFEQTLPKSNNLVLGVYADKTLGRYGKIIDQQSSGALTHAITVLKFSADRKATQLIAAPKGSEYQQILLVGLGAKDDEVSELDWQNLGGELIQTAIKTFKQAAPMAIDAPASTTAQIAYGANLGSYYFDKYYTDEKRQKYQPSITLISPEAKAAQTIYRAQLEPVARAIWHTRNISNEPANVIYPESFVERWEAHFDDMDEVDIKVLDEDDMLDLNMGAIYGVGRGSKRPPRIMIAEYSGGKKGDAPVVLVGKGITFDTGGISIKGSKNMWNMKFDMSGASSVMGTLHALAGRNAKVNVVAVAALAENMPDGNAQRPGDVVTTMSGKTVQIRSTDAEGRLVLADGIYYADTRYNPKLLIDLATLTGSAARALGKDYAALFTRHDELSDKFIAAGKQSGDEVWPLPLNDNHFKAVENNVADVMNSGPKAPGASAGAAFIGTFVRETTPWVHLDIAGVAWGDHTTPTKASPGSTSFGVRLLNHYIAEHFEK